MVDAYCVKCKEKRNMVAYIEKTFKNGRTGLVGKCPSCGSQMVRFVGQEKALA